MKTTFVENTSGLGIEIIPETPEDFAMLLRFANNAKRETPDIFLSFSNKVYMNVYMRKIRPSIQQNLINPKRRKR